ncbi:MAG: triphosphoribosyl-dephospho-CoA synthase [Candidatus Heimdallarchaeota archaeon]|nr:triphosphoribosyl-dephospho-CoA synthase [Candidatus Heimdallarchaeota archaeon]MDH5645561.1 triphosphoribosyl-dephospho-CoA synthase [Candidatus Heimdallarchaeota archaeon]
MDQFDYEDQNQLKVSVIANEIAINSTLSITLQGTTRIKPGDVNRFHNYHYSLESHLAGSMTMYQLTYELATRGIMTQRELLEIDEVDMGWIIGENIITKRNMMNGQHVNNNIPLLFSPISLASGYLFSEENISEITEDNLSKIIKYAKLFLENTTPEDTVSLFKTIHNTNMNLKIKDALGVTLNEKIETLLESEINLFEFLKLNKDSNSIINEIYSGYPKTIGIGLKAFYEASNQGLSISDCISHCYLVLLASQLDEDVLLSFGKSKANEIRNLAYEIIEAGGMTSKGGRTKAADFNKYFTESGNKIIPRTSLDITAVTTYISILCGFKIK